MSSRDRTRDQTVCPSVLGRRLACREGKRALPRAGHHRDLPEAVHHLPPTSDPPLTRPSGNQSHCHAHPTRLRLPKVGVWMCVTTFRIFRRFQTSVVSYYVIHHSDGSRGTTLSAEADEVELEDGMKMRPVSVFFPGGNISQPPLDEVQPLTI